MRLQWVHLNYDVINVSVFLCVFLCTFRCVIIVGLTKFCYKVCVLHAFKVAKGLFILCLYKVNTREWLHQNTLQFVVPWCRRALAWVARQENCRFASQHQHLRPLSEAQNLFRPILAQYLKTISLQRTLTSVSVFIFLHQLERYALIPVLRNAM